MAKTTAAAAPTPNTRTLTRTWLLGFAVVLAACGGGGGDDPPVNTPSFRVGGQLAGLGVKLYQSDEDAKDGTDKPIDTKKALDGIEATPVKAGWRYSPAKGGVDDGGQPHDGPMAQQVRKHMGEKVAPGGKAIDVASMNAHLMAGMQELVKRVKKIEKRVAA